MSGTAEPFRKAMPDGDTLTGTLHRPVTPKKKPFVLLLHGLTGSEDSMYMLESARHHLSEGRAALRMNLRGAGSSLPLCRTLYSGGSWPDVLAVLDALDPSLTEHGVVIVGYSMGGNILLNALPHLPEGTRCIGAASVSAPIDPMSASRRLMQRRNYVYQRALLDEMKQVYLELPIADEPGMRDRIAAADSIFRFDNTITGPMNGYADAADYYTRTAGQSQLNAITLPLLLLHAANDPWIPVAPYRALEPQDNIDLVITPSGGHVGFHGRDHAQPWHDLRISAFIDSLAPKGDRSNE